MKNKIYKYTVMSRQNQVRAALGVWFMGDVTVIHKRTNWRWLAKLWAWRLKNRRVKIFVVEGHVETEFKDNQP